MAEVVTIGGRLALREDGDFWVGYFAPKMDSMAGAVPLASMRTAMLAKPERKAEFVKLCKHLVGDIIEHAGARVEGWSSERKSPESDRTRKA